MCVRGHEVKVGSSQNRNNWQVISVMRLRNVLSLITVLALKSRDVDSVDPHGVLGVFMGCPCGVHHNMFLCDVDEDDDDYYNAHHSRWSQLCC